MLSLQENRTIKRIYSSVAGEFKYMYINSYVFKTTERNALKDFLRMLTHTFCLDYYYSYRAKDLNYKSRSPPNL